VKRVSEEGCGKKPEHFSSSRIRARGPVHVPTRQRSTKNWWGEKEGYRSHWKKRTEKERVSFGMDQQQKAEAKRTISCIHEKVKEKGGPLRGQDAGKKKGERGSGG